MSNQQLANTEAQPTLLQIIIKDPNPPNDLVDDQPELKHYVTATIGAYNNMRKRNLLARLWNIFDFGLFGIHERFPGFELASVKFTIRWVGDDHLPEMCLRKQEDFGRALALMEARSWKNILVAYCDLKEKGSESSESVADSAGE